MINVEFESYTSLRKEGSKGMQMVLCHWSAPALCWGTLNSDDGRREKEGAEYISFGRYFFHFSFSTMDMTPLRKNQNNIKPHSDPENLCVFTESSGQINF